MKRLHFLVAVIQSFDIFFHNTVRDAMFGGHLSRDLVFLAQTTTKPEIKVVFKGDFLADFFTRELFQHLAIVTKVLAGSTIAGTIPDVEILSATNDAGHRTKHWRNQVSEKHFSTWLLTQVSPKRLEEAFQRPRFYHTRKSHEYPIGFNVKHIILGSFW
uniref:Uncharacterized protein n=1 Tax=viral metagenome TaxID=1070528 RepID=A0A6C0BQ29_9ZZZZ